MIEDFRELLHTTRAINVFDGLGGRKYACLLPTRFNTKYKYINAVSKESEGAKISQEEIEPFKKAIFVSESFS